MLMPRFVRTLLSFVFVALALSFLVIEADARAGRGSSIGSRGMRTYSAPPSTATAPNTASPVTRSMTQPGQPGTATAARPTTGVGSGLFNRPGLLGGLAAGFLGAGLLGLLFGHGLFGGLGGFASMFGLLLQIALIVIVARLIWVWFQRREQPAYAGTTNLRDTAPAGTPPRTFAFGGVGAAPVEIAGSDYDAFERLLGEIQQAYGDEDLAALRQRVTPEMLSYFSEELADNASRGVVNKIASVKLEQGDLAESWRESDSEYATVAMRFSFIDKTLERASGRLVEGSDEVQEATELWTFRRARGGQWMLSAIQQA
jgi:predicted lipid-binding transport protein (Tim44 family)